MSMVITNIHRKFLNKSRSSLKFVLTSIAAFVKCIAKQMEIKMLHALFVSAFVIVLNQGVDSQYMINECDSYRAVYETFSSCAVFVMYNSSERNTLLFDRDILDRQDLIDVVNYWCSLLDEAASCTNGGALQCRNQVQIASVVSQTGGVCRHGHLNEAYKNLIPVTFRYNTRCMSKALDITEKCETHIQELDDGANIDEGVVKMERTITETLDCKSKQLRSFDDDCVSSQESVLFFTLRALTFSVPHALGVDLDVSTVLAIIS